MSNQMNVQFFYDYLKSNNLSKRAFCKICKISVATFEKILSGTENFKVYALYKISRALNIDISDMILHK